MNYESIIDEVVNVGAIFLRPSALSKFQTVAVIVEKIKNDPVQNSDAEFVYNDKAFSDVVIGPLAKVYDHLPIAHKVNHFFIKTNKSGIISLQRRNGKFEVLVAIDENSQELIV